MPFIRIVRGMQGSHAPLIFLPGIHKKNTRMQYPLKEVEH